MSERKQARRVTEDPWPEDLEALFAAAYPPTDPPAEPSETLEDRLATLASRSAVRSERGRLSMPPGWVPAIAAAAVVLFLVFLGTTRWDHGQAIRRGQPPPSPSVAKAGPDATGAPLTPMARGYRRETATRRLDARAITLQPEKRMDRAGIASAAARVIRKRWPAPARSDPPSSGARDPTLVRPPDDLAHLRGGPAEVVRWWTLPQEAETDPLVSRLGHTVRVRDDFVQIAFPRLASTSERQIAQAAETYRKEAAVVDARLAREVTLQQKATALSDLCDRLRSDTGIQLGAGQSVADEKVTIFCKGMPLRDVMRQLGRPFGYTWLRSGKAGEYRYELVQDLKSQLMEEELRNRDRNEALLALERDIERYRSYLGLSPDEALAREKSARPEDKRLFGCLSREGWGPIHIYYRLSRQDMEALRAGQELIFSMEHYPGERPLPPDLERGVLQSVRTWRIIKFDNGFGSTGDLTDPRSQALTAVPEVHAQMKLGMSQSELGQFTLYGLSGFFTPRNLETSSGLFNANDINPLATGRSPAALKPENGAAHAGLAHDPALRGRATLQPQPSCRPAPPPDATGGSGPEPKVTTADVLEALHRATGLPIVADHYTRLYKPQAVSVRNMVLFDALNHLSDAMRLRWNKDGNWLQFRSASYYHDRLKEVPNRFLASWSAARQKQGMLTLDDVVEIAQLPDAQLDGAEMAEGAENCFGLAEWELLRDGTLRSHVRYLAQFTPEQRQEAMSATGLPFTKMSLAQQQGFIARALGSGGAGLQSLEEMAGAALRVDFTHPGWFQWREVGEINSRRWAVPIEPGRQGRRVLLPPVRERTREAALQTARRVYPQLSEAMVQEERRYNPLFDPAQVIRDADIHPTRLDLVIVYIPGLSNGRSIRWFRVNQQLSGG